MLQLLTGTAATFITNRNEFVMPIICIEGKWYQISKQLFVRKVLLGRQQQHDRLLPKEKPVNAAQRVVSKLFPDVSVGRLIPTQKAINFGPDPKQYHWPVAVVVNVTFSGLPDNLKSQLRVLGEAKKPTKAEQTILRVIDKNFQPRIETLEKVAAIAAA